MVCLKSSRNSKRENVRTMIFFGFRCHLSQQESYNRLRKWFTDVKKAVAAYEKAVEAMSKYKNDKKEIVQIGHILEGETRYGPKHDFAYESRASCRSNDNHPSCTPGPPPPRAAGIDYSVKYVFHVE
ncbi:hypothetical protein EVAR_78810_1 [Eumeta japonica]|uniref:Uncharacterized protein n=1 Tax=Eumeta variegata TaxID=151549 RepID=A0A4C1T449_EUMVA|nr:hypothetical protein EVAR_78810_1 [Eumeta japonica]